jgi:hypothetical protein
MLIGQVWANHHVMFDHIRHADRLVLFLNTVLLMDIAFLPFAAAVLASSFRDGQGERTAVVLHGIAFELAAALFNVIWWHARHDHRLLASTIDPAGVRAISRRFQLALAWLGAGTLLGALLPTLGAGVIAAFIVYYWLPISGEIGHQPRTGRSPMAAQRGTRLTRPATRPPKPNHRAPAAEPMFRTRHREEGIHARAARRARDPSARMATTRPRGRLPLPPAHIATSRTLPQRQDSHQRDRLMVPDPRATMVPPPVGADESQRR